MEMQTMTLENTMPIEQDEIILNDEERQACEIWTRVMGYHRPVSSFNIGKKGEVFDRKYFLEPCSGAPVSGACI